MLVSPLPAGELRSWKWEIGLWEWPHMNFKYLIIFISTVLETYTSCHLMNLFNPELRTYTNNKSSPNWDTTK
jgi:hypothetical protein